MIKKIIFCSIIIICLLSPVSSLAMELSLPEIYSLSDLGYGLVSGAQWDFSGQDEFLIQNILELSPAEIDAAATMRVRHFLEKYALDRGIPFAENGQAYDNPKDFLVSTYFNKNVTSLYQKYQIELANGNVNADATLRMPISRQSIADWSGYRVGISQRYLDSFVYGMDIPDNPEPNPDPDYISYINNINEVNNGTGFFWKNYGTMPISGVNLSGTISIDYTKYSYMVANLNNNIVPSAYSSHVCEIFDPITIYITSNEDNLYSFSYTGQTKTFEYSDSENTNKYVSQFRFYDDSINASYWQSNPNYTVSRTISRTNQTLDQIFSYLSSKVRNCVIYVDGDLWADGFDQAPADPFLPTFPDVINPYSDYPIELVDLPATPDNNGTFDLTSLFDALKDAIIGASDSDPATDFILDKDAVNDTYRDTDGELTDDEDIPLEDIIDDSFPIQDTLNYPDIILPYEPIHNAFMGTTVLAQLIDATQNVLPEELILVFWGIVFILFIIGLIKILHK